MPFSGRLRNKFIHFMWKGLDWLFPPQCAGCNSPNTRWCIDCSRKSRKIIPPYCFVCGSPGDYHLACEQCQLSPPEFFGLRSCFVYGGEIRNAIHRLKYNNDIALGEVFSDYLVRLYKKQDWQANKVMSVPLSRERLKQRGYNQSSMLAGPLAEKLNLPHEKKALFRERDTRSQVGLSAHDRIHNVWGAFRAEMSIVQDQNVLLVDDVTTTGSTLNACAYALKQAGAQRVYCITLARSG